MLQLILRLKSFFPNIIFNQHNKNLIKNDTIVIYFIFKMRITLKTKLVFFS